MAEEMSADYKKPTMLETVTVLAKTTEKVVSNIEQITYDEFAAYLDKRQWLIERMQRYEWSDEEIAACRPLVRIVLDADATLREKMIAFRDEASIELNKIASGRKQQHAYQSTYEPDSLFFDRKR